MRLRQVSTLNAVGRRFLEGLEEVCPFLTWYNGFYNIGHDQDRIPKEGSQGASGDHTRALNEDPSFQDTTQSYITITKSIIYARPQVDKILEKRGGPAYVASQLDRWTYKEGRRVGYLCNEMFINGDSGDDAADLDGIINLQTDDDQIKTDGMLMPVGQDQHDAITKAVEKFLEHVDLADATDVIMNDLALRRLIFMGKELGYYNRIQEFGQEIDTISGVRLRKAGKGASKARLLPFNETVSGTPNCATFIFLRHGEGVDLTSPTSSGLIADYEGAVGSFYRNSIDLDMGMGLQNPESVLISKGWRLA